MTPRKASIDAGFGPDLVRDILSGKTQNARSDSVAALAQLLGVDANYLTGVRSSPTPDVNGPVAAVSVRVIGPVQAGHFLLMGEEGVMPAADDAETISSVPDRDFPHLELIGFKVLGDSIDRLCPEGGYAIAVDFAETGLQIHDRMVVVADRFRSGLVERTIKVVRKVRGKFELHPASTNPVHKPITFPSVEPSEEVRVIALVRHFVGPTLSW